MRTKSDSDDLIARQTRLAHQVARAEGADGATAFAAALEVYCHHRADDEEAEDSVAAILAAGGRRVHRETVFISLAALVILAIGLIALPFNLQAFT
ncbi:MAG: hypothetical protein VYC31_01220, partial [Pseudomonadota bacterium]|nr:hypothetical protein [Pseudomonadota bacterium]